MLTTLTTLSSYGTFDSNYLLFQISDSPAFLLLPVIGILIEQHSLPPFSVYDEIVATSIEKFSERNDLRVGMVSFSHVPPILGKWAQIPDHVCHKASISAFANFLDNRTIFDFFDSNQIPFSYSNRRSCSDNSKVAWSSFFD
jgi:hypothetical protein